MFSGTSNGASVLVLAYCGVEYCVPEACVPMRRGPPRECDENEEESSSPSEMKAAHAKSSSDDNCLECDGGCGEKLMRCCEDCGDRWWSPGGIMTSGGPVGW